jgi:hypothetical protein
MDKKRLRQVDKLFPDSPFEEYIEISLDEVLEQFTRVVKNAPAKPSFQVALSTCSLARSAFARYVLEYSQNFAEGYQSKIENLLQRAQRVLNRALANVKASDNISRDYISLYVAHNAERIRLLNVLHQQGEEQLGIELLGALPE